MVVEIVDGTTPMLGVIRHASREVAFEQMSKIGARVKKNVDRRMKSTSNYHGWNQKSVNGKLRPYYSSSNKKQLGERTKKDGSVDSPSSMSNMVRFMLMEKSGVMIVGGKMKNHSAVKRVDGKIVGAIPVKAVSGHTQSIIHKLDTGKRNSAHGWGSFGHQKASMSGGSETHGMHGKRFKARYFMVKGFNDSKSYMKSQLTAEYEKVIGRAINKADVKVQKARKVN